MNFLKHADKGSTTPVQVGCVVAAVAGLVRVG
jgi:hypothetical protein